jgi:hypothetical protein
MFLKFLLKSSIRAELILSFAISMLIVYVFLIALLSGNDILTFSTNTLLTYLIPILGIFIFGSFCLVKKKYFPNYITRILNVLSILLFVTLVSFSIISNFEDPKIFTNKNFEDLSLPNLEPEYYPDIYYIILDEYAGFDSLYRDFDFDNSSFNHELQKRGFLIPNTNYSNYTYTLISVPSSLNMQYLIHLNEQEKPKNISVNELNKISKNNLVMKNLDSKNYHIVSFYAGSNAPGSIKYVDEKLCQDEHYFNFFKSLINRLTPVSFYQSSESNNRSVEIKCSLSQIPLVKDRISKPIFVLAHIIMPHAPYVFDKNGDSITYDQNLDLFTKKKLYIGQLEFTNNQTIQIIDSILEKSKNPPVIIIHSDHGERSEIDFDNPTDDMIHQGFNNLNAIYLPNKNLDYLNGYFTQVNTFRIVFNEYFNADFELLKDEQYWLKFDQNKREFFDLERVTDILSQYDNP